MKTLQQLCPTLNNAELRLIWREVEGLLPEIVNDLDTIREKNKHLDQRMQDMTLAESSGFIKAVDQTSKALRDFIGAEPMLDRLNRGEG